jgi:phospholipid N-methyltransferase
MAAQQTEVSVSQQHPAGHRPHGRGALVFARNFFRHPRMLGSIVPSSRYLIRQLLSPIDWSRARVIVEYGPGVGVITAEILERMRGDALLVAIETNPEFVQLLSEQLPDPRLRVVQGSAESVDTILRQQGAEAADYIISGIPFSILPGIRRQSILRKTCQALAPDGAFLVYQFSPRVLGDLRRTFGHVRRTFEPRNVLPAYLFFCQSAPA